MMNEYLLGGLLLDSIECQIQYTIMAKYKEGGFGHILYSIECQIQYEGGFGHILVFVIFFSWLSSDKLHLEMVVGFQP